MNVLSLGSHLSALVDDSLELSSRIAPLPAFGRRLSCNNEKQEKAVEEVIEKSSNWAQEQLETLIGVY